MAEPQASIAHVSTVHRPLDTRIFLKMVTAAEEAGFDVCFVVPDDGSASGDPRHRFTGPRSRNRWHRFTVQQFRALREVVRSGARIVHVHDPELFPVFLLLKLLGRRVVVDMHEDLSAQVSRKYWIPRPLRPLVARASRAIIKAAVRTADASIAATPAIAASSGTSVILVQNFPQTGELLLSEHEPMPHEARDVIVFIGGITELRGLSVMLSTAELLLGEVRLVLAGRFRPAALEEIACGTPNVEVVGHLDRLAVRELMGRALGGLVLYQPAPNHIDAQPTKLFEYMSAGLPLIASDYPLWREVVSGAQAGLLVPPDDPEAIASAVRRLREDPPGWHAMAAAGPRAVRDLYNWERESEALTSLYAELAS